MRIHIRFRFLRMIISHTSIIIAVSFHSVLQVLAIVLCLFTSQDNSFSVYKMSQKQSGLFAEFTDVQTQIKPGPNGFQTCISAMSLS